MARAVAAAVEREPGSVVNSGSGLGSGGGRAVPRSVVASTLTAVVRLYQALRAGRPSPCRYYPTCSNYALEAIEAHGAARGGWLAVRRLGRCHPWGGKGIDLVPERSRP